MFDIAQKYQASIFGNFADILPAPEVISKLLGLFRDKNLLPGTFQEITQQYMGPQLRLRLSSQDKEWNVNFATHRMDVEKNPTDLKGKNLGNVEEFAIEANQFFNRILTEFSRKANRVSLATSGLLKQMAPEKMDSIYSRLFTPIEFYRKIPPFEWNSRFASRVVLNIAGSSEQMNTITSISRVNGHLVEANTIVSFDRLEVGFDINSAQENQETRFDTFSLVQFYEGATNLRQNILLELEVLLNA